MAKKNTGRDNIKLESTESSYFYTTTRNKRNQEGKIEIKKYDPILKKRVLFKENKIK